MQQIYANVRQLPRYPVGCFEGQPHFARQIEAARRLAPAEGHRGHAAVMLSCGESLEIQRAEEALRELWPLDAVHLVRFPVPSWDEALVVAPGTSSWLRHYVMREIQRRDPTLLVILDRGPGEDGDLCSLHSLVARLREWGATAPVAALRVNADWEVEWLSTPAAVLENTG